MGLRMQKQDRDMVRARAERRVLLSVNGLEQGSHKRGTHQNRLDSCKQNLNPINRRSLFSTATAYMINYYN